MAEAVAVRARARVLHSAPASRASCPSTSATECARLNRNEENSLGAMRGFPMRAGAPLSVGTGIGKAQPEERRRQAWPLVLGRSLSLSPRPISRNLRRPTLFTPGEPAGPQFLFGSVHMPPRARAAWRPCSLSRGDHAGVTYSGRLFFSTGAMKKARARRFLAREVCGWFLEDAAACQQK